MNPSHIKGHLRIVAKCNMGGGGEHEDLKNCDVTKVKLKNFLPKESQLNAPTGDENVTFGGLFIKRPTKRLAHGPLGSVHSFIYDIYYNNTIFAPILPGSSDAPVFNARSL